MANTNHESVGTGKGPVSTTGAPAAVDARIGLAKLELTEFERKRARWALARGTRSMHSFSNWVPGLLFALILIGGQWIANAYVDPGDRVTRYFAYALSSLTALVFVLVWTVRTLSRRLDAVTEIMEQQQ